MAATCGGDGSSFSSGVDKGAELGGLSSGDAQKLCTALNDWMTNSFAPQLKEMTCRLAGLTASGIGGNSQPAQKQAACTTAYDSCMKQPARTETGSSATCSAPPTTCKATVGELESCVNEISPMLQMYLSSFPTCQQLGSGTVTLPTSQPMPPQSCTTFQSKCQGLELPGGFGD
jgi:hypothetical protein